MAGGMFKTQNKIRPGAYINFKGSTGLSKTIGLRGIVTLPLSLDWGDTIVTLTKSELLDGKSIPKIGYSLSDPECQIVREALKNCASAILYRLNTSGTKAAKTLGNVEITAKYEGIAGNNISVSITAVGESFGVSTMYKDTERDYQLVKTAADLVANDWVTFKATEEAITACTKTALEGGDNGSVATDAYDKYLAKIRNYNWTTMGVPADVSAQESAIVDFIKQLRDSEGRKVQAVLYNSNSDYEGIISCNQGYKTVSEEIAPTTFIAYLAGLTAGSDVTKSNTYFVIEDAVEIIGGKSDSEIEEALLSGKCVLTNRQDGCVIIEQDINTLHTFNADKPKCFKKNRVIRTLDDINNSISLLYAQSYIGKVSNTTEGQSVLRADIISYLNKLNTAGAITNFAGNTDVVVSTGDDIDSVVIDLAIQPVDSMEKLYMTVSVG